MEVNDTCRECGKPIHVDLDVNEATNFVVSFYNIIGFLFGEGWGTYFCSKGCYRSYIKHDKNPLFKGLFRSPKLMIVLVIIFAGLYFWISTLGKDYPDKVFVLKEPLAVYESIVDTDELEEGKLFIAEEGLEIRIRSIKEDDFITWIKAWYLKDNIIVEDYFLIPEKIDARTFNDENLFVNSLPLNDSSTWNAFFTYVDEKNSENFSKYKELFLNEIKDLEILSVTDNIEKQKIEDDKSFKFFPEEGYFGEYLSDNETFFYSSKENFKTIKNIYKKYSEEYKENELSKDLD